MDTNRSDELRPRVASVRNDFRDRTVGFKDPGRRGRLRFEEPCSKPESIKVRNWGINKYNDPIKEKRININIPMLGMILTNCIKQLHQRVKILKFNFRVVLCDNLCQFTDKVSILDTRRSMKTPLLITVQIHFKSHPSNFYLQYDQ